MTREKYPRTYHFPFSPGRSSDDKILHDWKTSFEKKLLVFTEKLDGGNTQINKDGVFARSISTPASHPTFDHLKATWSTIRHELDGLTLYGENMYGIHSIEYTELTSYFYLFGVKYESWSLSGTKTEWLGWEDVEELAAWIGYPTAPKLGVGHAEEAESKILQFMKEDSLLGGPKEGIVVRNYDSFPGDAFSNNVVKYVRENHVQTDEHWTRNWKPAKLKTD